MNFYNLLDFQGYERLLTTENAEYSKVPDIKAVLMIFFFEIIEVNKKDGFVPKGSL